MALRSELSSKDIYLSSLPGVAVSSIKIEGVLHEFSTIPGVKEDVTEIVLNIKSFNKNIRRRTQVVYISRG